MTLLEYPNKVQNIQLFKRAEELISQIGKVFPHVAGSRLFKVLLSKPHDQDWDFMTVLNKDGMVMDVNVVKVKEGRGLPSSKKQADRPDPEQQERCLGHQV